MISSVLVYSFALHVIQLDFFYSLKKKFKKLISLNHTQHAKERLIKIFSTPKSDHCILLASRGSKSSLISILHTVYTFQKEFSSRSQHVQKSGKQGNKGTKVFKAMLASDCYCIAFIHFIS